MKMQSVDNERVFFISLKVAQNQVE